MNDKVCCGNECGQCGGNGCKDRPGGKTSCCASFIPKTNICGVGSQKAPCHIKTLGSNFNIIAHWKYIKL